VSSCLPLLNNTGQHHVIALGTQRATPPKLKPVKAAGKRKISAPVARADSAPKGQPTFDDAMHSIHEKLAIKIEKDARDCEISTREAILAAQPTEKRSAFHSGFDEWRDRLCASATEYYNNCFPISAFVGTTGTGTKWEDAPFIESLGTGTC